VELGSNDTYSENIKKSLRDTNGAVSPVASFKESEVKIEVEVTTGDNPTSQVEKSVDIIELGIQSITLGGGCFWGLEAVFKHIQGVESVTNGYSGGTFENPDYETVSDGDTGHAEVCQVFYDPEKVTLSIILSIFFAVHDPTSVNK